MIKKSKVATVIIFLCTLSTQNAFAHKGFSVKNFINHTDPFSKAKEELKQTVIDEPYNLYNKREYLNCYNSINESLKSGKAGDFKTDLLSLMITCYVSTPSRRRPAFNLNHELFDDSVLVKKVFRDLGHETIRALIDKRTFSLDNEALMSNVFKKPSIVCLFDSKPDFANQLLNRIAKREDFHSLNLQSLPCGFELNVDYRHLLEDRETYSLYVKKGISVFKKRASLKFKYIKSKISKKEYSKFRRLNKVNKIKYLKDIKGAPDYVINRVARNLFYRNKFDLLNHLLDNDEIPLRTLSYVVKAKVASGEYDDVLKITKNLSFLKGRSSEEILLMRAGIYLRKQDFKKAEAELLKMRKYVVDLKLSALYWRWVALKKLKKKTKALEVSKELLENYPFSYYGLLVASENEGIDFFDRYSKKYTDYEVKLSSVSKKDMNRLKVFYKLDWISAFKSTYNDLSKFLSPKERALFALAFSNLGKTQETIKILNSEWDNNEELRAEPFLSKSFSFLFSDVILKEAKKNERVSPPIIRAVIRQESAFQEKVKSGSGAKGLMQLMNPTARELARQLRVKKFNPNRNLYDGALNIKLGSKYMDRLIYANNHYLPYAFASYNAGPGKMNRWSSKREEIYKLKKGLEHRTESVTDLNEFWIEELPWVETRFYTKALLRNMGIYIALSGQKKSFECRPFWICK